MYLYRRTYVENWDCMSEKDRWKITMERPETHYRQANIDVDKIAYVEEKIAYWRKAYQIHSWFVEHVQGGVDECQTGPAFGVSTLKELVDVCKDALESRDPTLLEPESGFFFGSTDIDEWYWEGLRETISMLEPYTSEEDEDSEFLYHSSW